MSLMQKEKSFLVFGSNGEIGRAVFAALEDEATVFQGARNLRELESNTEFFGVLNGVVWAQGMNVSDSINSQNSNYGPVLEANVSFIIESLKVLLEKGKIAPGANLLIIGSIWGQFARPEKLSYMVSKSAVLGLVRSLAIDLAHMGVQVNAISPGPIDTEMTKSHLTSSQLDRIISETPLKRLVTLQEVAAIIYAFLSGKLGGVTGQEIVIDGGWSVSKLV